MQGAILPRKRKEYGTVFSRFHFQDRISLALSTNRTQYLISIQCRFSYQPVDLYLDIPTLLQKADITPIYKKNGRLDIENYRPISVWPCLSKILQCIFIDQSFVLFAKFGSQGLSAYKTLWSSKCTHVYLEKANKSLDNKEVHYTKKLRIF